MAGNEALCVCVMDEKDILLDLKALIKEYYVATFTESENALKITFENGQTFLLSVKEV